MRIFRKNKPHIDGVMNIEYDEGKTTFSLHLNGDPFVLQDADLVIFKVNKPLKPAEDDV